MKAENIGEPYFLFYTNLCILVKYEFNKIFKSAGNFCRIIRDRRNN